MIRLAKQTLPLELDTSKFKSRSGNGGGGRGRRGGEEGVESKTHQIKSNKMS